MDGMPISRSEWASTLGVSKPAISQWVTGKTIPRPEHLAAIVGTVREDRRAGPEMRARVGELLNAPASELFEKPPAYVGPTLAHYLIKPVREAALKMVNALEPGQQYELLMEMCQQCRQLLSPTAVGR
jgi:transcriptional regulator with XRE-family HTH domain